MRTTIRIRQKIRAVSHGEDCVCVQYSTQALLLAFICFFALCSCFSSPGGLNLVIPIHNDVASPPSTSTPQNLNRAEKIPAAEIVNQPNTEVKPIDLPSFEGHQHTSSNSKSRGVSGGLWSWVLRLILMCFCLMVVEAGMGSGTPPEKDKHKGSLGTSKDNTPGKRKRILQEAYESEKRMERGKGIVQEENENRGKEIVNEDQQTEEESQWAEIEGILGGREKVYEYFRDEVFKKKCVEEIRNYGEEEAKEAWGALSSGERIEYADEALFKYYMHDENLEGLLNDDDSEDVNPEFSF